jgi:hypothetical protein
MQKLVLMKKRIKLFLFLSICANVLAFGQNDSTKVIIQNHTNLAVPGIMQLRLSGFVLNKKLDSIENVEFTLPKLLIGPEVIVVFFRKDTSGPIMRAWSHPINFNGSGTIIYSLEVGEQGKASQWPAVTWKATKNVLDVYMNDIVTGSTQLTRGIEPNKKHKFVWKRGSSVICDTIMSLPFDVKRTCTCDEQKKLVRVD